MITSHQEDILNKSLGILASSNRLLIEGSAGTGKTFLVGALVETLIRRGASNIICSAPTNKAVAVLKEKIKTGRGVKLATTHSAMKMKRQVDYKTGDVIFKPSFAASSPPLKNVNYLIIDEASMIPSDMLFEIESHATSQRCKVIFVGDLKQLPPVKEESSPIFRGKPIIKTKAEYVAMDIQYPHTISPHKEGEIVLYVPYPKVELTEIIRQAADNPVIQLSRNLSLIKDKIPNLIGKDGYIFTEDNDKVISTLAAVNGTDQLKYLAYTNAEVDKINKKVRERIYKNPKKIEEGETLIFNTPYKGIYFTNEELKVDKVQIKEEKFLYPVNGKSNTCSEILLKYYSINFASGVTHKDKDSWDSFMDNNVVIDNIIVIHEDSEKDLINLDKKLKALANAREISWVQRLEFIEQFADFKYNHAITVHKSQGSTFSQVIINVKNLNLCKEDSEKDKLVYTAVTRTSGMIIFYNN